MKKFSKILSVALLVALVLSLGATSAFAGTNTITVSGAQTGETYKIYKMLDLAVSENDDFNSENPVNATSNPQYDSFSYTLNDDWAAFWTTGAGKDYIETTTVGTTVYVSWKEGKGTAEEMEAFGKAAAAWAEENDKSPVGTKEVVAADPENGIVAVNAEFTGLDNGYYLITTTFGTAATVASTPNNADQQIREKNPGNSTDKDVKEDSTEAWQQTNDAQIGQEVEFRSKVTIAKNTINVVYHDTMGPELTWTGASNVKVYTDATLETELATGNYTVAAGTAPETFTVSFNQDYVDKLTEATTDVYVAYSGILNDEAVVNNPVTNTPKVTWGDSGKFEGQPTETTTYKFEILKYDGKEKDAATKKNLAGAKFKLYTAETGGTALKLCVNATGTIYRVVDTTDAKTENGVTTYTLPDGFTLVADDQIVTVDSTNIIVEGIDQDIYYLEETEAPQGYNKINGRQSVTVESTAGSVTVKEIENNSGSVLPSTGGIGTTIFYAVGGILVLAAIVLLITKKRMSD